MGQSPVPSKEPLPVIIAVQVPGRLLKDIVTTEDAQTEIPPVYTTLLTLPSEPVTKSIWPYVALTVGMSLAAIFTIAMVTVLRPKADHVALVQNILIIVTPVTVMLSGIIRTMSEVREVRDQVQQIHVAINSRMDQLLRQTAIASRSQGQDDIRKSVAAVQSSDPSEEQPVDKG